MRESPPSSSDEKPALPVARCQEEPLTEAIRAGRYDADISGLAAALEPDVRAKLEVADPCYLADRDPFR